jgi:hypothetical protein
MCVGRHQRREQSLVLLVDVNADDLPQTPGRTGDRAESVGTRERLDQLVDGSMLGSMAGTSTFNSANSPPARYRERSSAAACGNSSARAHATRRSRAARASSPVDACVTAVTSIASFPAISA